MKKRLVCVIVAMVMMIAFSGCGRKDVPDNLKQYSDYVRTVLECRYYGDVEKYMNTVDADEEVANGIYQAATEYYGRVLMYYNGVDEDYISEELYNKFMELARTIMSKAKFEVKDAVMQNDQCVVEVIISPINLNDISETEIKRYMEIHNTMFDGMDMESVTEEQWRTYEETYGYNVHTILTEYVSKLKYKDAVSKIIIIDTDKSGFQAIAEEDWFALDDYVVDMHE